MRTLWAWSGNQHSQGLALWALIAFGIQVWQSCSCLPGSQLSPGLDSCCRKDFQSFGPLECRDSNRTLYSRVLWSDCTRKGWRGERTAMIFPVLQLIPTLLPPKDFCVSHHRGLSSSFRFFLLYFPLLSALQNITEVFGRQYFCSESGNPLISSDSGYLGSNNHIQTLNDFWLT